MEQWVRNGRPPARARTVKRGDTLGAYFVERDDVEAVVAYLEGSTEGRRLLEIGERALEKGKPVLMWKVGNSQSGRRASISHTARLTADQTLFQRAIDAGGFIEIGDTDDLVDVAQILRHHKKPKGNRVAVITAAGGAGVLMADQCEQYGLQLPEAGS